MQAAGLVARVSLANVARNDHVKKLLMQHFALKERLGWEINTEDRWTMTGFNRYSNITYVKSVFTTITLVQWGGYKRVIRIAGMIYCR